MPYIKCVNEDNGISYDTVEDVDNCIRYIFNICKTMYDEKRPGHMLGDFVGCSRFFGTVDQEKDCELVIAQMLANNSAYGKWKGNLLKHRVISFRRLDNILPNEAYQLAKYIADAYGENYIAAYGVHLDTNNIHIHLAIDTICWRDGSRFDQPFEMKWLYSMTNSWLATRDNGLVNNWKENELRLRYYGDL
ncbi:MAG: relaxase/mobilization nuclease domain-containing protein [Clostridiales bacterium]|nr:relaxase/mobilization nuclease domain-containing protein [Clostridiales bacterium]